MLLCRWKQYYASLDKSVQEQAGNAPMQLETELSQFGQIYATGNAFLLPETILCKFGQEMLLRDYTDGWNFIWNFLAKI